MTLGYGLVGVTCDKCGSRDIVGKYRSGREWWRVCYVNEHIVCRCKICGYRFTVAARKRP